jgi:uncharacterized membrane protein YuzA (DUF378 family)
MVDSELINTAAKALVIVAAVNWGLVAFADFNLVVDLLGFAEGSTGSQLLYAGIAAAGVYEANWLLTEGVM